MGDLLGARYFAKLDLLHGHWKIPLAPEAKVVFMIVTPWSLYSPTRVQQGASNDTTYYQPTLTERLRESK